MTLIKLFHQRFVVDNRAYLEQQSDGSYFARYRDVSVDLIERHLTGEVTIATPAASLDGLSIWVCFDDDNVLPEFQTGLLDKIEQYLKEYTYYCIRSTNRRLASRLPFVWRHQSDIQTLRRRKFVEHIGQIG